MNEIDEEFEKTKITIFVKNRTGRKLQTSIWGWGPEYDLEKILKHFQKKFHCTGSIINDEEFGSVIKLTGNHKVPVYEFLVNEEICTKRDIVLKGL